MRNFLFKSKNLFASDPIGYADFSSVFEAVRTFNHARGYYDTDTFNIEEILSLLEMQIF